MNQWIQKLVDPGCKKPSTLSTACSESEGKAMQDVAAFLGDAMTKLSVREREKALDDLHGVVKASDDKEDADSARKWLEELDQHINEIKRGTIYEVAESMHRDYVTDRDFRMMFLRAVRYDPKAAAARIIKFLNLKQYLFGVKKLAKTISIDDLDDDDKACLRSGGYQLLPCTDTAGRLILFAMPSLMVDKAFQNELRARYYVIMTALGSNQSQLQGFITVWYVLGKFSDNSIRSNTGLLWDLPLRREGVHFCVNDMRVCLLGSVAVYRLPRALRSRSRIHVGSHLECQHALASFGIPRSALPVSFNGEPLRDSHLVWLRHQQRSERNCQTCTKALNDDAEVTYADVIFGRGRRIQEHIGNVNFRRLLERNRDAYDDCARPSRQDIAEDIVRHVKANCGRF